MSRGVEMKDLAAVFGVSFGIALRARHRRGVDRSGIEVVRVSQGEVGEELLLELLSCYHS